MTSDPFAKSLPMSSQKHAPDLAVVGAGIVGLWCAARAADAGLDCLLLDSSRIAGGASGGVLGALMPHQPVRWSPEKAYQLEALISLESEIARLEGETGLGCGYLRCGRLIPTRTEKKATERLEWQAAAKTAWPSHSRTGSPLGWKILSTPPDRSWLDAGRSPLGCEFETLSARVDPRALTRALDAYIRRRCAITPLAEVTAISRDGTLELRDGTCLTPGHTILAAGHGSFRLLEALTGRNLGRGIKGQAALLQPRDYVDPTQPIIYDGGVYVIVHDSGLIAAGSTSEKDFDSETETTGALDDVVTAARALCPTLRQARVVERWAGVRPNAVGRHPIIGPLPEAPKVVVCTGGFKISFALAHRLAEDALGFVLGRPPANMPESFGVAAHYAEAERKAAALGA